MQKGIKVNEETYEMLSKLRRPGQSFEGAIIELMNRVKEIKNSKR